LNRSSSCELAPGQAQNGTAGTMMRPFQVSEACARRGDIRAGDTTNTNWIAQRKYIWRPLAGRPRIVDVQIGAPRRTRREWASRLRIAGLPREIDERIHGIDAVQALELALSSAGKLLAGTPEFRAGQIEQWDKPVKYDTELFLPLPMSSLQTTLEGFRQYVERTRGRGRIQGEMLRNLLSVVKEIQADLATLAAHLPIIRRRA
jgi:uncharacterized protein DUF6968